MYKTLLRRNAQSETATRRSPPRRPSLDVPGSTLASTTLLGRLHPSRRVELGHKAQTAYVLFVPFGGTSFFGISLALVCRANKIVIWNRTEDRSLRDARSGS